MSRQGEAKGTGRTVPQTVTVVGGGLAGLAAATVLAEQGVQVRIVEAEQYLGGRAGAWNEDGPHDAPFASGHFQMERGFHAFFRQYYNLRALMRRVDPNLSCLEPQVDYPILGPLGAAETFSGLSPHAPLNVAQLVWRTPTLGLRDLMKINARAAASMLAYGPHTYAMWDHISAREYLDSLNFPRDARQMLFEVFSHSFFNPEEDLSAAELLMQFHFYFMGNPEGLVFDTMRQPFGTAFFEPLERYLGARGVRFRLGQRATQVQAGKTMSVHVTDGRKSEVLESDAVVLALAIDALRKVVAQSPDLGSHVWREDVDALQTTSAFAVWRLWLDRRVRGDRAPFAGTVGHGLLDNISVYERLEDESRQWADQHNASIVELHAYALPEGLSEAEIRTKMRAALEHFYPETQGATAVFERFLVKRDCPGFAPGSYARRPGVKTPDSRLMLAGDFVKTRWPSALMERATLTGFDAANRLLGREAQTIRSVPERGMLAALGA